MIEILKNIFENVNRWLQFAETKNALLATFNGGFIIGILSIMNTINKDMKSYFTVLGIVLFFLLISIIVCFLSFIPVLKKLTENVKKPKDVNFYYFGHLASLTTSEFTEKIVKEYKIQKETIPITKHENDIAYQIVTNAEITLRKYLLFKIAIWLDIIGLFLGTLYWMKKVFF